MLGPIVLVQCVGEIGHSAFQLMRRKIEPEWNRASGQHQCVGAAASKHMSKIVKRIPVENIIAAATKQLVHAQAADEDVISRIAHEDVVAIVSTQVIVVLVAVEYVVSGAAEN